MKRKNLFTAVVIIVAMLIGGLMIMSHIEKVENAKLLENTPLTKYTFYYSLDYFPKYKIEAAKMVEQLMEQGVEEKEACLKAIDVTSDKIYQDTLEFYNTRNSKWDAEPEDTEAALEKFMSKKQR